MAQTSTENTQTYRLMSYNIGGGHTNPKTKLDALSQVIEDIAPDILILQEVIRVQDGEGQWHTSLGLLAEAVGDDAAFFFAPTLSLQDDLYSRKKFMITALSENCLEWQQGNAIISRWTFHQIDEKEQHGDPTPMLLYRSTGYEGSRDTESRGGCLARIGREPSYPIVAGLHLTTLVGERDDDPPDGVQERARKMRCEQTTHLLALLQEKAINQGELVFVLGDFNALADEDCIKKILLDEGGFIRLEPEQGKVSTHPEIDDAIDHILIFPDDRILETHCFVAQPEVAMLASDHYAVVADVTLKVDI